MAATVIQVNRATVLMLALMAGPWTACLEIQLFHIRWKVLNEVNLSFIRIFAAQNWKTVTGLCFLATVCLTTLLLQYIYHVPNKQSSIFKMRCLLFLLEKVLKIKLAKRTRNDNYHNHHHDNSTYNNDNNNNYYNNNGPSVTKPMCWYRVHFNYWETSYG